MDLRYKVAAQNALKDTVKAHKAHTRWLAWCAGLSAARKAAGLYDTPNSWDLGKARAVDALYMEAYKRPANPSKASKYRMYDNAYRAARLAGVEVAAGSLSNLDDIATVISTVTAALAAVESTCAGCGVTFNGKRGLAVHQNQKFVTLACRPQI